MSDLTVLSRKKNLRVVGLMSGTSVDGIDVAIIDYGSKGLKMVAFDTVAYSTAMRKAIFELFNPETAQIGKISTLNYAIGEAFAAAVVDTCKKYDVDIASINLVGSHGQTIYHDPAGTKIGGEIFKSTLQIGEPCVIAQRTGICTVADFRTADIAAGGEGAPLVPFTDYILLSDRKRSRVSQNIGGIANCTYLPANGGIADVRAFDTGPGNMIIDALVSIVTGGKQRYDKDGKIAAIGTVHQKLLKSLMIHPYFKRTPPKSSGREMFGQQYAKQLYEKAKALRMCNEDIIATATAFTALSIAQAYERFLPGRIDDVILCGGGARNPTLASMLQEYLPNSNVFTMDKIGIDADAKEAISFAILAAHTLWGQANNVPAATGASKAVVLGKIIPIRKFKFAR